MQEDLSRTELIHLIRQLQDLSGVSEADGIALHRRFCSNVPHPEASDLIFHRRPKHFDHEPSAEEIVDKALSYKPIAL